MPATEIRTLRGPLLAVLGLLLSPLTVAAFPNILSDWQTQYPGSLSDSNANGAGAECILCHNSGNTSEWNAYGYALRQNAANFLALEGINSDGDPGASTNLQEITANSQPGWTPGNSNSIYNAVGLITAVAPPPAGILGNLDPVATVDPVANPGGPYGGTVGQPIAFDASGSSAPGGTIQTYDWDFGDTSSDTGAMPSHAYASAGIFDVSLTVTDDQPAQNTAMTTATVNPLIPATPQTLMLDYDLNTGSLVQRPGTPEDTFSSGPIAFGPVTLDDTSTTLRLIINFAAQGSGADQSLQIGALGTGSPRPETFASRLPGDCDDGETTCSHNFGPGMVATNSAGAVGDANTLMLAQVELTNPQGDFAGDFLNPYIKGLAETTCDGTQCSVAVHFPDLADGDDLASFGGIIVDLVFANSTAVFTPVTVDRFQFNLLGGFLAIQQVLGIPTLGGASLVVLAMLLMLLGWRIYRRRGA